MKSICHITTTPQSSIPRLLREASTVASMGIKPYIVAQGKTYEEDGISFLGVGIEKSRWKRMIFTSRKIVKRALKVDSDIYQIHDPELLPFALLFKKRGKVVIFDSHEFYGIQIELKTYIPQFIRKVVSKTYTIFETFICKRIDAVIAVCTVNGVDYFKGRARKTIMLSNLPDSEIFSNSGFILKKSESKSVVYVGSISASRGITNVIRAIGKVNGKLYLCGPVASKSYYDEISNMDEFRHVDYRGIVSRKAIIDVLNISNIGISTLLHVGQYSEIDTMPTKVYEYMALGLPVIISDTNYALKLNEKYKFGICVNPNNVDQIAEAIEYLSLNPVEAVEMGKMGMELVKNEFNWKIEEQKLINLYKELLM
jgi:glycosyltransferase involved in cell wall biosynthesis